MRDEPLGSLRMCSIGKLLRLALLLFSWFAHFIDHGLDLLGMIEM